MAPPAEVVQCVSGVSLMHFRDAVAKLFGREVIVRGAARLAPEERAQL